MKTTITTATTEYYNEDAYDENDRIAQVYFNLSEDDSYTIAKMIDDYMEVNDFMLEHINSREDRKTYENRMYTGFCRYIAPLLEALGICSMTPEDVLMHFHI